MTDPDPVLLSFAYAAKQPQQASMNYRWVFLDSGAFLHSHNASGAVRPATESSVYWFDTPLQEKMRLSPAQRDALRELLRDPPAGEGHLRALSPSPRGDFSRLQLQAPDGVRVYEIEDRTVRPYDAWLREVFFRFVPAARTVLS